MVIVKWLRRLGLAWVLYRLLGTDRTPRYPGRQVHPLRLPGRTVFVGDREIFMREAGPEDGPPLVLIHGWGDHSVVVYGRLIPLLAERFRVTALDNRNSGKSDFTPGDFSIEDVADDVAGALSQIGVSRALVVGYSMGGLIAQALTRRHPHLVERLVLAATAAAAPGVEGLLRAGAVVGGTVARALDRISRSEVSRVRIKYLVDVGAVAPEHAAWFYAQHRGRDPDAYWAALRCINRFDSRDWVGRLEVPTLIIITCDDQLMPPSRQYDLASRLRDPEVVELVGARHEAPLTHAERIAEAVIKFAAS